MTRYPAFPHDLDCAPPASLRKTGTRLLAVLLLGLALGLLMACRNDGNAAAKEAAAGPAVEGARAGAVTSGNQAAGASILRVEARLVCMVNDMNMGREQIPVIVGEKTYFGCCAACELRLAEDRTVRFAIDPVSGKQVDKADAVIGVYKDGSALYFENEANLLAFRG